MEVKSGHVKNVGPAGNGVEFVWGFEVVVGKGARGVLGAAVV